MKIRSLLLIFLLMNLAGFSQPSETIYLGNIIKSGYSDEESFGPFDIGFSFTFYGNAYTQFYASSNGLVLFGSGSTESSESAIPAAAAPNNFIAPFWDDLVISSSGKMLYRTIGSAPNRKLIIQGTNMGFYPNPLFMGSFLVILYETTNVIQVQYRIIIDGSSARAHGESATIGIENAAGTDGIQYAYHSSSAVSTGKAVSFTPSGSTYLMNSDAVYDGVLLTTNITLPEPGIPLLLSPPQDAVIGSDYTFEWSESGNSASYTLLISPYSDLGGADSYNTGSALSYAVSGLTLDATYYWGVFATNTTGTTWCEIKRFTTISTPPLAAVPQTVWVEQSNDKTIKLNYTGGDAGPKTAIITSLPAQGQLFQYDAGVKGAAINSVPATVTDAAMNVIYTAPGSSGNGIGNFNFKINDGGGDSPEAAVTINVSPPGIPSVLCIAKGTGVEIQFDRTMSDPSGKQSQFEVKADGSPVSVTSAALKAGDPYTILLSLSPALTGSETVLVSYTMGDITSAQGGFLMSFTDQPVTLTSQTITFTQSLDKKFSDSPLTLTALASSGLGMTYSSSNLTVATISTNKATFHSLGTSAITARQEGDATWAPAKYIKTLTVSRGDQVITFNAIPDKTEGDPDFNPGATASSGLAVTYYSDNPAVATIVSNLVHIVGPGTANITASQPGNVNYFPAIDVIRPLTIDIPTGVNDRGMKTGKFQIYYTSGNIFIKPLTEDWDGLAGNIRITDIIGRLINEDRNVEIASSSQIMVQAPGIMGLYLVEIRSGDKSYVGKIVVR